MDLRALRDSSAASFGTGHLAGHLDASGSPDLRQRYWPDNGEIDIMEHVGFNPDVVHGTVHTKAYNHLLGTQRGGSIRVPTARTDFHVYAIEWTPEEIRWFVDDSLYYRFPNERLTNPDADWRHWPFDQPFHLIMNIAVGGTWGGQQGVDPEAFPAQLVVDYVRVYRWVE